MGSRLQKNSLVKGAFISYISIILIKVLGLVYIIPFYGLIGAEGGFIYACIYSVYNIFLQFSILGIPSSIAIIISEYETLGDYASKEKAYKLGFYIMLFASVSCFLILFIFAKSIALFFINDVPNGISINDISTPIRAMSFMLLIAPFLFLEQQYLIGHKYTSIVSISTVFEQILRIVFILGFTYLVVKIYNMDAKYSVVASVVGTILATIIVYVYLIYKKRKNNKNIEIEKNDLKEAVSSKVIIKKIFNYSWVVFVLTISARIYILVDSKFLLYGLNQVGYPDAITRLIVSNSSEWINKICYLVNFLVIGITGILRPYITEVYVKNDKFELNNKTNNILSFVIMVTLPLFIGMMIFSSNIYSIFYGYNEYGSNILRYSLIVDFIINIIVLISIIMQSLNLGKVVVAATIAGTLVNIGLDLPLIYLFDLLRLPAYIGAIFSSIIGQSLTFLILLYYLKNDRYLDFAQTKSILKNTVVSIFAMSIVLIITKHVFPFTSGSKLMEFLYMLFVGVIGLLVYLLALYKTGGLKLILHNPIFIKLVKKIKRN